MKTKFHSFPLEGHKSTKGDNSNWNEYMGLLFLMRNPIMKFRNPNSKFFERTHGQTHSFFKVWGIKSNITLGFLRRNLKNCPEECRKLAYISLVRPTLEYGLSIWDPCLQKDIIHFIEKKTTTPSSQIHKKEYRSREYGCLTNMLKDIELSSLQQRREFWSTDQPA